MKHKSSNLKYSPSGRRVNLDATRYGPVIKLAVAAVLLIAAVLLTAFVLVPWVQTVRQAPASDSVTAAKPTPLPAHPILTNVAAAVTFGDQPAAVVADPSIHHGRILYATGDSLEHCDQLVRLDPETGESEVVALTLSYDTVRYPSEDDASIVYIDAKLTGGGNLCIYNKETQRVTVVEQLESDIPRVRLASPYLVWTERTGADTASVFACNLTDGESVSLKAFRGSPYAASAPFLVQNQALYADADGDSGNGLIRSVLLDSGEEAAFAAGSYVHDPKSNGVWWAYMTGDHDTDSDLYIVAADGKPRRIARGVIDFYITPACVVFSRDETVYAYVFDYDKVYVLSATGENAQLVTAGGDYALWRDMTDAAHPVWRYMKVV